MLGWDRRVELWVVSHRVGALDSLVEGITYLGTYGAVWLALAGLVAVWTRRPRVFGAVLLADVLAQGASGALKLAIPRERPHVDVLVARSYGHSFPSGHATASFACATVLAAAVPRARVPLLVLAVLVAWSRLYVGVHYPLDVVAGALLGAALGALELRALRPLGGARRRSRRAPRPG